MLPAVQVIAEMDDSVWHSLWFNLRGITEVDLAWKPHPQANSIRWIIGHLTWFEEWAHDALNGDGRYLTDTWPTAYLDESYQDVEKRFKEAYARYQSRLTTLEDAELERRINFFGQTDFTVYRLLKTHALHLSGHRYQVRYIRGTYSRAFGTRKADFDPM